MDFHRLVVYYVFRNAHAKNSLKWATCLKYALNFSFNFLPANFDRKTPQIYLFTHTKSKQMKIKSIWGVTEIRNSPRCSTTCRFWPILALKHKKKIIWPMQGGVFFICPGWGTSGLVKKIKNGHKKRSNKSLGPHHAQKIESWPLKANSTFHSLTLFSSNLAKFGGKV